MLEARRLLTTPNGAAGATRLKIITEIMVRPDSQDRLAARANVSPGTVSPIVRALREEGWIGRASCRERV